MSVLKLKSIFKKTAKKSSLIFFRSHLNSFFFVSNFFLFENDNSSLSNVTVLIVQTKCIKLGVQFQFQFMFSLFFVVVLGCFLHPLLCISFSTSIQKKGQSLTFFCKYYTVSVFINIFGDFIIFLTCYTIWIMIRYLLYNFNFKYD